MPLDLTKIHGSLNDIFVIDGAPTDHFAEPDIAPAVRTMCDRGAGLGADGVYFVADHGDGTADAHFFNPDGSSALLCGNGMRGAGRLLLDRHEAERVVLRTGPYAFTVRTADTTPHGVRQVAVGLPPVDFRPAEPIVAGVEQPFVDAELAAYHDSLRVSALAVPNSHLISVLSDVPYDEADLIATGTRVAEDSAVFPIGANVSFVRPLGDAEVFIRTFERGAGLTPSCGSGVSASRAVLSQLGVVEPESPVLVRNPGGVARSWLETGDGRWRPVLEGNATKVYSARVDAGDLVRGVVRERERVPHAHDIAAFEALKEDNLKVLREAGVALAEPESLTG
jgi:diaminopimelate epimerase